jgi:hypothetical protein
MSVPTTFVMLGIPGQITFFRVSVGLTSVGTLTGKPVRQDP